MAERLTELVFKGDSSIVGCKGEVFLKKNPHSAISLLLLTCPRDECLPLSQSDLGDPEPSEVSDLAVDLLRTACIIINRN